MQASFLALDIGGTYLKAALFFADSLRQCDRGGEPRLPELWRVPSRLDEPGGEGIFQAVRAIAERCRAGKFPIRGVGISTAGIVDDGGNAVVEAAGHLQSLCNPTLKAKIEEIFGAPAVLINDADAALIGAAALRLYPQEGTTVLLAVGTGLGCAVVRNSHRFRPGRAFPLLGAVETPVGSFDRIAGAVGLARRAGGDLAGLFRHGGEVRDRYLNELTRVVYSAALLYQADHVLVTGGLAAAAADGGFDLAGALSAHPLLGNGIFGRQVKLSTSAVPLQIVGAAYLARGCAALPGAALALPAGTATEQPRHGDLELSDLPPGELVNLLFAAENEAGAALAESLPAIAEGAALIADAFRRGGRLVYVGAGTSGRLAAVDAVELPCTFGIAETAAVALIAGGNVEAAITIESGGEEDISSLPELLLLNLTPDDVLIGISASGSAYYVRSALAYARQVAGARTVMIQESLRPQPDAGLLIPLRSGSEVVAGSTRMKAGTATKKVLNMLTTAAMIALGHTRRSRMIHMKSLNEKLRRRKSEMGL